jgi:pimeloyl-ACP methyl ester carboxylesterase
VIGRLGDIVCYLADGTLRDKINSLMSRHIDQLNLRSDDILVLIGHSLGSVVAVHFLLSTPSSVQCPVILITLGSPLAQLSWWFPTWLSHPRIIARMLLSRYPGFRWINVFRPRDIVGKSLELAPVFLKCDVSTKQHVRFFPWSHTNYWSDPRVWAAVAEAVQQGGPLWLHNSREFAPPRQILWFDSLRLRTGRYFRALRMRPRVQLWIVRVAVLTMLVMFCRSVSIFFSREPYFDKPVRVNGWCDVETGLHLTIADCIFGYKSAGQDIGFKRHARFSSRIEKESKMQLEVIGQGFADPRESKSVWLQDLSVISASPPWSWNFSSAELCDWNSKSRHNALVAALVLWMFLFAANDKLHCDWCGIKADDLRAYRIARLALRDIVGGAPKEIAAVAKWISAGDLPLQYDWRFKSVAQAVDNQNLEYARKLLRDVLVTWQERYAPHSP